MTRFKVNKGHLRGMDAQRAVFVIEYVKDFAVRRAAEAAGYNPESGYRLLEDETIKEAVRVMVQKRIDDTGIDAEWLLYELADNHMIARQQGNISASNAALKIIAQLAVVDAMAKQKVELDVVSDKELTERIKRGRDRALPLPLTIEQSPTEDETEEVSFI